MSGGIRSSSNKNKYDAIEELDKIDSPFRK